MTTRVPKSYLMPDMVTVTNDVGEYVAAWQALASPIEEALQMKLIAYDPEFIFASGNPQRPGIKTVQLQPWFVERLSKTLQGE